MIADLSNPNKTYFISYPGQNMNIFSLKYDNLINKAN